MPRSLIAELLADGEGPAPSTPGSPTGPGSVLDLCTGNGSLAVLAALAYPEIEVDAADISRTRWRSPASTSTGTGSTTRITLLESDLFAAVPGPLRPDPLQPAVRQRASAWPRCRPSTAPSRQLALAGGDDGMDFVRRILRDAPDHMTEDAVLVLEIGHERAHFEARLSAPRVRLARDQRRRRSGPPDRAPRPGDLSTLARDRLASGRQRLRRKSRHDRSFPTHPAPRRQGRARPRQRHAQPGEKVGLVGRNGAGKSSLFSLLADRLHADAGDVEMPPRWRIAEVAQEMPETAEGATDFVLAGRHRR